MVLMLLTAAFIGVIIMSQRWFLKKKSIKFIGKNKNKKSLKFVVSEYLL